MQAAFTPPTILPVILAGGIGARLAPISTPIRPKPFIPLADGESLLSKTLARIRAPGFRAPLIIGRAEDRFALLNHARAAHTTPAAILLEAAGRNTAAAVALAALWAQANHGDGICLAILPADHAIAPAEAWHAALVQAALAAQQADTMCLLTATPTVPDPAFGYALTTAPTARHPWQALAHFVEKPAEPEAWIAQGARWNMGQFVGSAGQFVAALEAHAPDILAAARHALANARQRWEFTELAPWPPATPSLPFDKVVLERALGVAVPFTGQWQDLGHLAAWQAFTGLDLEHYAQQPARTDRPWGYFECMHQSAKQLEKRLIIYPGCRLSLQRHRYRTEQWRVLFGTAHVELDGNIKRLSINEEIAIPAGSWHRLGNHHSDILIIKEIQFGNCDESDIERVDDDYGRN